MSTVLFQTWMLHDYDLSLTDAMVYATIYGFSHDGQGCYFGSIRYLMETLDISESTAKRSLKMLESKGLLQKWKETVGNVTVNRYAALRPAPASPECACTNDASDGGQNEPGFKMDPVQNDTQPGFKMTLTRVQNDPQIIKENKRENKTPSGARGAHEGGPTTKDVFSEYAGEDKPLLDALTKFDAYRTSRRGKVWDVQTARAVCAKLTRLADEAQPKDRSSYMIACLMQSIEAGWSVLDHPKSRGVNPTRSLRGVVDRPEPSGRNFLKDAAHRRPLGRKYG